MGTTASTACPAQIRGVLITDTQSATIDSCSFVGGSGSTIMVLNHDSVHTEQVDINQCIFMNNGQPSFSEYTSESGKVVPGPASVEVNQ